ncbi:hypothetical protein [Desertivirga arenae]|uniref:hypothetical protein n=1 Tax=Desertivirga arenae TaxID=2810309 RepID=UPI001A95CF44|nr:hypothetical protein [Pedobacter sp. SYSU D00823]
MLIDTFENESIHFWIDRKHFSKFPDKPKQVSIVDVDVINTEIANKWKWFLKLISELWYIIKIFFFASKGNVRLIYFCSLSPLGTYAVTLFSYILFKRIRVIITLHSELGLLKEENKKKIVERVYAKLLLAAFRKQVRNLKFLILNEEVANSVTNEKFLNERQIISIDHPYIFEVIPEKSPIDGGPIVFGHLGVAKLSKRSHLFFKLAESMKEEIELGIVKFIVVGRVLAEMMPFLNNYVEYSTSNKLLDRDEYIKQARDIDYSVFLYDDKSYGFTSSGAIMDALAFEKPILSIQLGIFNTIFGKDCPPGYVYNNFEEMNISIRSVIDMHKANYTTFRSCMTTTKERLTVSAQLPSFKKQLRAFLSL